MTTQTVAVTGATGQLGRAIVQAIARVDGVTPIAVARTPGKAADLGVEVRAGDYDDPAQLDAAFQGTNTVVLVSSNTPPDVRIDQHKRVIDAARAAHVSRLIYSGIVVSDAISGLSPVQEMSKATEDYVRDSGLRCSVGRNGLYIEPDLESVDDYVAAGKIANCAGEGRCAYTSRSELAVAYAHMATDPLYDGHIYQLTGEPITQHQLAETINQVFDTDLSYEPLSVEDYRAERIAALGETMGTIIAGIYEEIQAGAFDVPSDFGMLAGRPHRSPLEMARAYRKRRGRRPMPNDLPE